MVVEPQISTDDVADKVFLSKAPGRGLNGLRRWRRIICEDRNDGMHRRELPVISKFNNPSMNASEPGAWKTLLSVSMSNSVQCWRYKKVEPSS